jgi:hypothetical protein
VGATPPALVEMLDLAGLADGSASTSVWRWRLVI